MSLLPNHTPQEDICEAIENGDDKAKIAAIKSVILSMLSGESFPRYTFAPSLSLPLSLSTLPLFGGQYQKA